MIDSIPIENQKERRLFLDYLGLSKERNKIVIKILISDKNQSVSLPALQLGLKKLIGDLNKDEVFQNKEIIIVTDGTNFGIAKIFGNVLSVNRLNFKLIGLNSLQNIFEKNELDLEVIFFP